MSTSSDEVFLATLLETLRVVGLEVVIVGSMAAALQGAPIITQDIDLLIRDTALNRQKVEDLARRLGGSRPTEIAPLSRALRIAMPLATVDIMFDEIAGSLTFNRLRSRSVKIPVLEEEAVAARLEDVIASKQAAGRPKDLAQLPILRDTLRVKQALADGEHK